jgi:hypothetical protein
MYGANPSVIRSLRFLVGEDPDRDNNDIFDVSSLTIQILPREGKYNMNKTYANNTNSKNSYFGSLIQL